MRRSCLLSWPYQWRWSSQAAAVQASRSMAGIGLIRIDQPMRQQLTAPGPLQRTLLMSRISTTAFLFGWSARSEVKKLHGAKKNPRKHT